ncbi:protein phosphatase 2C family protein [bacterium]|nr:protein phosphatase 2C family protein [bacterium]
MDQVETTSATAAYRSVCEDRVAVFGGEDRTVIVVADGAGGVGSGEIAAETVINEVASGYKTVRSGNEWAGFLHQIDCRISLGESTAVVVDIRPYGIAGASVGDSQAWMIADGQIEDLTKEQVRKPLLGSGTARPVAFTYSGLAGSLIVATDVFFNYAKRDQVIRLVSETNFYEVGRRCLEMVRLPSGELWDDVGIVVARHKPIPNTRKQYEI